MFLPAGFSSIELKLPSPPAVLSRLLRLLAEFALRRPNWPM